MSVRLSSGPHGSESLAARWRLRRRRAFTALIFLALLLLGGIIYELWRPSLRISRVQIYGADQSFAAMATEVMQGSYFGIIPRDSTFFFPESRIRADITSAHPDIAAISIFRNGLTGLSIKVNDRVPVARWCGSTFPIASDTAASTVAVGQGCYLFDASGVIYATSTAQQLVNSFVVYESIPNETSPIGATLSEANRLPSAFDFARQLNTLGSPVTVLVLRGDEIDDYLKSGTRVTYVFGNEQNAFTALVSARQDFNLADGSIDYVDLRFDGKVYLKKKVDGKQKTANGQ